MCVVLAHVACENRARTARRFYTIWDSSLIPSLREASRGEEKEEEEEVIAEDTYVYVQFSYCSSVAAAAAAAAVDRRNV